MTLYRRGKSPFWYVKFQHRGQIFRKSTGTEVRKEAEKIAADFKFQATKKTGPRNVNPFRQGTFRKGAMMLSDAITRAVGSRYDTQADCMCVNSRLKAVLKMLGDRPLSDITASQIADMSERMVKTKSPATVNRHLANLKTVMNIAKREWETVEAVPYIRGTLEGRVSHLELSNKD